MQSFASHIEEILMSQANATQAVPMAAYMKHHFAFYGVKKPQREALLRSLVKETPLRSADELFTVVDELWRGVYREEQYSALWLLHRYKKFLSFGDLDKIRRLIVEKSWWDSVDDLAAHSVGTIVLLNRSEGTAAMVDWSKSQNLWLRRSALIHQLKYKDLTDAEFLFACCERLCGEKDFFIRKAIGWALREYAKTNPQGVRSFVQDTGDRLSGLSKREALRRLD